MLINGGRWTLRGIGLHGILVANDMSPGWEPVQPGLYHGVWLLLHPPRESTFTELEQIDIEGRTAMARSCLWTLGGIALLLLGATLKSWL